ncbi:MAG: ATP-binding protein [Pseudomonadota bacterium]
MKNPEPLSEVQELAQELEKYRQIVETASDAVVSVNQHHEVVYMNAAAERLFGYQRGEILGGDLSPLIPHEHRQAHRHYLERYLRTGQARLMGHSAELLAQRKDGTQRPISISFSQAQLDDGPLFTAIMRDLSAERSLAQQAKQSQQLALVGQTVATVSHEIRTPLVLIGGFARQLGKEKGLSPQGRQKLEVVTQEVRRLEGLLSELNDLARPQRYAWQEVALPRILERVRELMEPQLKKDGLGLHLELATGLPKVAADPDRLSQVLINLVQNAAQASQAGQVITLGLEKDPQGQAVLTVGDQGAGIAAEHLSQVFNPFFTTKKRGTGLGLPLARRIVEEHGGRLELMSQPGLGTRVRVSLPALGRGPRAVIPIPEPAPEV